MSQTSTSADALARLAAVIESRLPGQGGDPDKSYVARLLHKGPDAFLKKVGEEATEVVMAAKDADHGDIRSLRDRRRNAQDKHTCDKMQHRIGTKAHR